MLMNNLDPAVAERPEDLVVYGGTGKAARTGPATRRSCETLRRLDNDETLLVQSGKPVGVFRTHDEAPRVLIANAHLVPRWATWDEFRRLEALGLTMYGQMTAGSWIYIGTQGILQGTYETFAECARQHFGGTLAGRLVVTGGLGGMGGAQPLAATMNGAAFLGIEVDESPHPAAGRYRLLRPLAHRSGRSAGAWCRRRSGASARPLSVGLVGNVADVLPELVRRGVVPDVVTDQTSAHDLRVGYIPAGLYARAAAVFREKDPDGLRSARCSTPWWFTSRRCSRCRRAGTVVFDYGNNLRGQVADHRGMTQGVRDPGFRSRVHPAALLPRRGTLPLGGAVRRSRGHRRHRPGGAGDLSRERGAWPAGSGTPGEGPFPGTACADLLAGVRRARRDGTPVQLAGASRARSRPPSSSGAIISTPDRSPLPTGRPRA